MKKTIQGAYKVTKADWNCGNGTEFIKNDNNKAIHDNWISTFIVDLKKAPTRK